jgi:PhzF family phenazine biosynthesis protein
MSQPIYVVDAFTDEPFRGNPAAVCPLPRPADAAWMQQVAAEMNLSETAFLYRQGDAWNLRWFTPTVEVDLCGHATLASAHLLWETNRAEAGSPIRFLTRSGPLGVVRSEAGYEMDFPARPVSLTHAPPAALAEALGVAPVWVGTNGMDALAELEDEASVVALRPNFARLEALPVRGLIVTALASTGQGYDFVSRFFAPASGVPEDPVTGSAHCALGPYWAERLGKADLVGYQASRRGGRVRVGVRGNRVLLGGRAVTVLRGELTLGNT